jgi:UDP-N-acetyl-D-mannosaminuronate dehydrogenase
VVVCTKHSDVDYGFVVQHSKLVVDTRNATDGVKDTQYVIKA